MKAKLDGLKVAIRATLGKRYIKLRILLFLALLVGQLMAVRRLRRWGKNVGLAVGFVGTVGGLAAQVGLWRMWKKLRV